MSWEPVSIVVPLAALAVGVAGGVILGRRSGRAWSRIVELEATAERLEKERESAQAELVAGREELARTREGFERYRGRVGEHFAGTSDLLRELTLQYRAVYDHLAQGAGALCPEALEQISQGLDREAIPGAAAAEGEGSRAAAPEEDSEAAEEQPHAAARDETWVESLRSLIGDSSPRSDG